MNKIDVIDSPTVEFFVDNYLKLNKPVVIRGIVNKWPAFEKWSAEYLSEKIGDKPLSIKRLKGGDYANASIESMTFAEYVNALSKEKDNDDKLYAGELPFAVHFSDLLTDINLPSFFDSFEYANGEYMYAGQSLFSQLHFHPGGSALLSIIKGYKKVRLYAPSETKYLYKYPWNSSLHNMSKTTKSVPDNELYPKFSKAKYTDVKLMEGEMLFIPIYWWHGITNEAFNIAVVAFWEEKMFRRLPPFILTLDYLNRVSKDFPEFLSAMIRKIIKRK